jgi:ferredoxin-NADP reductase
VVLPTGLVRQYSLCGDPRDRDRYRITVLREPDSRGGCEYLHRDAQEGTRLVIRAPRNNFELAPAERYWLIAGGIGITPLLPMLAEIRRQARPVELLYGGRTRSSMAFVEQLEALGSGVRVLPQDRHGLLPIQDFLAAAGPGDAIYCCGPQPLIDAVQQHCARRALLGQLHVERFAADAAALAGSGENHPFVVELSRSGLLLPVPADQSILAVLEQAGITVATSCLEGVCGSCETAVLAGQVEHRDSILTEQERAANDTMLVCVSRARGDRLTLEL